MHGQNHIRSFDGFVVLILRPKSLRTVQNFLRSLTVNILKPFLELYRLLFLPHLNSGTPLMVGFKSERFITDISDVVSIGKNVLNDLLSR